MNQLNKIRLQLAKILASFKDLKTSNGILYWASDEDLTVGLDVYLLNEDGEYVEAADGEYIDEDERVITVEAGKVVSIKDKEAEAPVEVAPVEEAPVDVNIEVNAEEEVPAPEAPVEEPVVDAVEELRKEVNELYSIVDALIKEVAAMKDKEVAVEEQLSKIGKMSAAFSAEEEIKTIDTKSSNSKLDAICEAIRNA